MPPPDDKWAKEHRAVASNSTWATRIPAEFVLNIEENDLINPYNLFTLLMSTPDLLLEWLCTHGLIANTLTCNECQKPCRLYLRQKAIDGWSWRCTRNKNHELSIRKFSFFSGSHLYLQDILLFCYTYISGQSLKQCSKDTGIGYSKSCVDWGSFIRDLCVQWVHEEVPKIKFKGPCQLDESHYGREVKFWKGQAYNGLDVWVFSILDEDTGNFLYFPVDNRDGPTLIGIVLNHIEKGAVVKTDGWGGYIDLAKHGYLHYVCKHAHAFKVTYINPETGHVLNCNTNSMEGRWRHSKVYTFNRIDSFGLCLLYVMFRYVCSIEYLHLNLICSFILNILG